MLSPRCSPTVLHLPFLCLTVGVEVNGSEGHGMSGTTVECAYSFCLVHTEGGAHERSVVKVFGVAVSALAVEHLTHVIRAIQLTSVL